MCGDIEEEARAGEELVARLFALAGQRYDIGAADMPSCPERDIAADADRHAYMDESFRGAMAAALANVSAVADGQRAEAIASQAIVLARLAGWLAGHLPPGADMMRSLMEAMLDGYEEPARALERAAESHHDHEHGHRH